MPDMLDWIDPTAPEPTRVDAPLMARLFLTSQNFNVSRTARGHEAIKFTTKDKKLLTVINDAGAFYLFAGHANIS
ncbi:hypothetical protein [Kozakia baliensis]|uniref:hypothetical protein n=1 Tax=Kozakia baliensis TaxID=153496 RepID=UPI00087B9602|nr:hypothetical protein [Kozakia baliensis]AOX20719.1 hypothetical protein A0U90_10990 [Kozakia baliensis]